MQATESEAECSLFILLCVVSFAKSALFLYAYARSNLILKWKKRPISGLLVPPSLALLLYGHGNWHLSLRSGRVSVFQYINLAQALFWCFWWRMECSWTEQRIYIAVWTKAQLQQNEQKRLYHQHPMTQTVDHQVSFQSGPIDAYFICIHAIFWNCRNCNWFSCFSINDLHRVIKCKTAAAAR